MTDQQIQSIDTPAGSSTIAQGVSPPANRERWHMTLTNKDEEALLDRIKDKYHEDIRQISEDDSELRRLLKTFYPWQLYRLRDGGRPLRIISVDEVKFIPKENNDAPGETAVEPQATYHYFLRAFAPAGELAEELSGVTPDDVIRVKKWTPHDLAIIDQMIAPDIFERSTGFLMLMQECLKGDRERSNNQIMYQEDQGDTAQA